MASPSVAVVGLGNLGSPMASHLLDLGWDVSVVDTDDSRVQELVSEGARAASARDLGSLDSLLFVVPGESAIRSVLEEAGDDIPPLVVVVSTLSPSAATDLGETLAERGARMLDAPVSGGADRARKGELSIFVGGEADDVDAARPLLDALGNAVFHLGPMGAGAAAKLANQLVTFAALDAVLQAVRLAVAHGVDEARVIDAFGAATGDTWVGRTWGFYDELSADYDRRGVPQSDRPWVKDIEAVQAAAADRGVDVPLATELAGRLADGIAAHAQQSKERAAV